MQVAAWREMYWAGLPRQEHCFCEWWPDGTARCCKCRRKEGLIQKGEPDG